MRNSFRTAVRPLLTYVAKGTDYFDDVFEEISGCRRELLLCSTSGDYITSAGDVVVVAKTMLVDVR